MDKKKYTKASEIIENEILSGIDHLFHELTIYYGYDNYLKVMPVI